MNDDIVRKIYTNGKMKTVSLPDEWGISGKYVKFEIIDDKELRIKIID